MNFKLVGVGELLWDLLPGGRQLGGAPANFAYHACALGAQARVISRVGKDEAGRELVQRLEKLGVPTDCIEVDDAAPTGTVTVEVASDGQPRFSIHEDVAWDYIRGDGAGRFAVSAADAVCFGTLAQRSEPSRSTIRTFLGEIAPEAFCVFDVNLRQHYYSREVIEQSLALANVLKVNDAELPRLAELFGLNGTERTQISQLAARHDLRVVAYTRGARGSLLFADGHWSDHPGVPAKVVDTVGAGDAFAAAMTLGLLMGWGIEEVNHRANEVAAYVASCAGATPSLPENLRAPFQSSATTK
jgi:fructokinase